MGILLNKTKNLSTWQELSLRKLLPRPSLRSPVPATNASSHAAPRSVSVVPRPARHGAPSAVDPDPATNASSSAAPRNASVEPRPAKPGAPSAVDPDPAPDASSLAAPRNASVAPRPARPLPPLSAAPKKSERDSVANTPPLYRLALPSGRVSLM